MTYDFGIEDAQFFGEIAYYGSVWLVEFRDYTRAIIIEDSTDSPEANYILEASA